jgi:copper oxidase (laccase) domain-containing protein
VNGLSAAGDHAALDQAHKRVAEQLRVNAQVFAIGQVHGDGIRQVPDSRFPIAK